MSKNILMLSNVKRVKNFELAIESLIHLDNEFRIIVYGDYRCEPEYYEELLSLIHKLNLTSRIEFRGYVKESELNLSDFTCLLVTSHSEVMPMAVILSMKNGLPIIGVDIPALSELSNGGLLFPLCSFNFKSISNAIINYKEISSDSLIKFYNEKLSIQTVYDKLSKLYCFSKEK